MSLFKSISKICGKILEIGLIYSLVILSYSSFVILSNFSFPLFSVISNCLIYFMFDVSNASFILFRAYVFPEERFPIITFNFVDATKPSEENINSLSFLLSFKNTLFLSIKAYFIDFKEVSFISKKVNLVGKLSKSFLIRISEEKIGTKSSCCFFNIQNFLMLSTSPQVIFLPNFLIICCCNAGFFL